MKNSIKYTSKGFIEFGCDIAENGHGLFLQYFVKDTGIGIPKNRHNAIFERFIQVDVVDKMARQGAGLGLAISKAYVEMLGGKIWIESEEGKGSTFWFTIPYLPVSKNGFNIGHEVSGSNRGKPDKEVKNINCRGTINHRAQLISIIIRKIAGEIITVENGTEAVRACFENPDTDLILMDISNANNGRL